LNPAQELLSATTKRLERISTETRLAQEDLKKIQLSLTKTSTNAKETQESRPASLKSQSITTSKWPIHRQLATVAVFLVIIAFFTPGVITLYYLVFGLDIEDNPLFCWMD
jgi:hypothetical protein